MRFTEIQDKKSKEITRYYLNGMRVKKHVYEDQERKIIQEGKMFQCFFTERTKNGNFKHNKINSI